MTRADYYKLRKVIQFIDDLSLMKYHIFTIDELKRRNNPDLIGLAMQMQGKHNELVKSLQDLLKQVKWGENT